MRARPAVVLCMVAAALLWHVAALGAGAVA
jgi:hypothetical protein